MESPFNVNRVCLAAILWWVTNWKVSMHVRLMIKYARNDMYILERWDHYIVIIQKVFHEQLCWSKSPIRKGDITNRLMLASTIKKGTDKTWNWYYTSFNPQILGRNKDCYLVCFTCLVRAPMVPVGLLMFFFGQKLHNFLYTAIFFKFFYFYCLLFILITKQ